MIHALDVVDDTASSTTNKDELGVEVTVIGDDDSAAAGQEGLRLCRSPSPILGNASLSTPSRAQAANSRKLMFAVCICFTFFLIQLVGGWLSHSLALVADSFHMLIDCAAYSISLFALYISRQKPTHKFSFGFARAEIFGALISVILIWSLVIILSYQAALRISTPGEPINSPAMIALSVIGLVVNIILLSTLGHDHDHHHQPVSDTSESLALSSSSAFTADLENGTHKIFSCSDKDEPHALFKEVSFDEMDSLDQHDSSPSTIFETGGLETSNKSLSLKSLKNSNINVQAAILHALGDLLCSVGVLISSIIIYIYPSMQFIDPVCTLMFSTVVLCTTIKIVRDVVLSLMEATPAHINISKIRENVSALPGTQTIEEFHVWALTNDKLAVSAKIKINHEAFGGKRHYLRRVRKEILNELDSGTSILSFIIELN